MNPLPYRVGKWKLGFDPYSSKEFFGLSTRSKTVLDSIGFQSRRAVQKAFAPGGKLDEHTWYKWRQLGIHTYNEIRTWAGMEPIPTKEKKKVVHCPKCDTEIVL